MAIDKHGEYMDLTLEEMESGIVLIKGFIEDLQHSVMGYMVTSHPDYDSINGILDNLRLLIAEYKRDLYEDFVDTTNGKTHETDDWSPLL
jgi:hypothetical protein